MSDPLRGDHTHRISRKGRLGRDRSERIGSSHHDLAARFVAARHHDFEAKDPSILNRMVLLYAVPVALFVGTLGATRSELIQDGAFAVAMCAAIVGMYTSAFLFFRFALRFSMSESVLAALAASSPAAPFMGPAILGDLFGKASSISIAIAALVINLVVVPITIFGLELGKTPTVSTARPTAHHSGFSETLLETFKQPMVCAPLLALHSFFATSTTSPQFFATDFRF